ncbi:MAG: TerB family tellurite resistance protein [Prochlorotrichaceae cyanobacterium]|jgi:uncharacterized membrane protein YebE (DUF533 family)
MTAQNKALFKILVGAAWIDGTIQAEEREYLRRKADEQGLADDPEIRPLLFELVQIQRDICYRWIQEYLGDNPSSESCQDLIEALSGLIYSDGNVDTEEAKLLSRIQSLDPSANPTESKQNSLLKSVQKLYRDWMKLQ